MLKRTGTTNDSWVSGSFAGGRGIGWARASMASELGVERRESRALHDVARQDPPVMVDAEGDAGDAAFVVGACFGGIALEALDMGDERTLPSLEDRGRHDFGTRASAAPRRRASSPTAPRSAGSPPSAARASAVPGSAGRPRPPLQEAWSLPPSAASARSRTASARARDRSAASSTSPPPPAIRASRPARRHQTRMQRRARAATRMRRDHAPPPPPQSTASIAPSRRDGSQRCAASAVISPCPIRGRPARP